MYETGMYEGNTWIMKELWCPCRGMLIELYLSGRTEICITLGIMWSEPSCVLGVITGAYLYSPGVEGRGVEYYTTARARVCV